MESANWLNQCIKECVSKRVDRISNEQEEFYSRVTQVEQLIQDISNFQYYTNSAPLVIYYSI